MRGGSDNVIVVEVANVEIGKKKNVGFNTFKLIFDPNTKKLSFHKDGAYAAERTANTEGCSVSFVDDPRKKKKGGEKWPGQFRVDLIQKNQTDKKDDIKYIISITDDDIRNELIDALQPADESPYRQKEKVEADEAASPRRSGLLGRLGGAKGGKKQEGAKEESGGAAAPPAAEDADKLLIQAAKDGNVDEVSKQLADGADKNATSEDDGRSVAIHAVLSQKGEQATINCLKALHSKGADFDRGDNNSFTPLMAAAQKGEPAVVKWLLQTGEADISKESGPGVTALSYAVSSKNKEVVRVLVAKKPLSNNEEFKKLITFLLDKFTIPVVGINEWKRDIFEEFDTDNNGEISIDEWEPLVADLTRKDESPPNR